MQGNPIAEFVGHRGWVKGVDFSADGQTLATSGQDGTARLWDLQGSPIAEFQTGHGWATSVSFSPSGKAVSAERGALIATVGQDSTVKLWAIEPLEDLLSRGCQQVADYLRTNANVENPDLCQGIL
ncbi:hypothetical protein HC928_24690 [bacterium]|nr:hypothetical protein [bacterium]